MIDMQKVPVHHIIKRCRQEEKGASALYLALVLFILMGMGAIAIDGSSAYLERRRMQTAADAAALAGTRILALGGDADDITDEVEGIAVANGAGNLTWTRDGDNVQFAGNSQLHVSWSYTQDQNGVDVAIANDSATYFARILGYDTITATASADAAHEPIVTVDNLIPLTINGCDCVDFDEMPVSIDEEDFAPDVLTIYQVGNATENSVNYTLYLEGLDPAYPSGAANRAYYMFSDKDGAGNFTLYGDGTALLEQTVTNVNGDGFIVELLFSGQTTTAPDNASPNCAGSCSTGDWHYYTATSGTLTGISGQRYAGAVINVTRRDAAFQVGTDAHQKNPAGKFGASGNLTLEIVQQPSGDITLETSTQASRLELTLDNDGVEETCDLYPIALHTSTLDGKATGAELGDIYNGAGTGNFGWLTWFGSPNVPTLATSLTPPGDSDTYVNPNDSSDTNVSVGDWVQGSPGVSNASSVRAALDELMQYDITVPVWDQSTATGNNLTYRVAAFANVRITDYRLPNQNRITANFLGYNTTCTTFTYPPPPPPTDGEPCQLAWLDWNGGIASNGELADYLNDPSLSGFAEVGDTVPAGPNVENVKQVTDALEQWLNKPALIAMYDDGDQENGYQICGFAQFTMTDYDFASLPQWLQGQFTLGVTRGETDPDAPDYGLRGIRFQ
jgi:Flp pilus assembly protein TadG